MTQYLLADPSNMSKREKSPKGGYRIPDAVYNPLWLERVKARVTISPTGCWLWTGLCNPLWGYGRYAYRGRDVPVHRQVYKVIYGVSLTREQYVCHACDVRNCCNPDHLWLGTNSDNQKDAGRKGRHAEILKTHCPHGHEYTPENTRILTSASGGLARQCKECQRIRCRERYNRDIKAAREYRRQWRAKEKAKRKADSMAVCSQ